MLSFLGEPGEATCAAGMSTHGRKSSLSEGFKKRSRLQEKEEWKRIIKSLAGMLLEGE